MKKKEKKDLTLEETTQSVEPQEKNLDEQVVETGEASKVAQDVAPDDSTLQEENDSALQAEDEQVIASQSEETESQPIEDSGDIANEEGVTGSVENGVQESGDCADIADVQDGKKKKKRKRRRKIDEYTLDNDIRYRGPLSFVHLRMLAWAFLIIAQIGTLLALVAKYDAGMAAKIGTFAQVLKSASTIMMPLFLMATFATILNGTRSFKSMLTVYGGVSLVIILLFFLFHDHIVPSILGWFMETDRATTVETLDSVLMIVLGGTHLSFNIFLDLFLCTLLTFFLIYRPKKVFVGKKLIIFRLFAILPILYEIASFVLKLLGTLGVMPFSPYFFPFLTTKPPMTFVVFVAIAFFIKARERIYRKRGKTHEEYQQFLNTNANSWQFAKFTALIMVVAGVLDIILNLIITFAIIGKANLNVTDEQETVNLAFFVADAIMKVGVGGSGALVIAAPIIMLFSYTRTSKNKMIGLIIPAAAIIILIFVMLEGFVIATKILGPFSELISKMAGE